MKQAPKSSSEALLGTCVWKPQDSENNEIDDFLQETPHHLLAEAYELLYKHNYDVATAKQELSKVRREKWSEEDIKLFIKGVASIGKSFWKIQVGYLLLFVFIEILIVGSLSDVYSIFFS